ncbi:hemolysin XhlA family protein [Paenibacillus macerans]|uniref:hemolysin XhlA family protein n=1 Tax=Paenibacillus macerans TaxID=44252 RepID=UPI003D3187EB
MNNPEMEMLAKINNQIGKLEGAQEASTRAIGDMATNINRLIEKMDKSDDIAREAEQRARSAHHRIDEVKKEVSEVKGDITWLWRAVIGAIITGVIGGGIALIWKLIGS